ncbi:MAG: HAMP domain-containing histidine kinase [Ignavibacteria bacterium]|nr:HAMP domain-containing histidine kinase [Ignavibacteria bacterium]
MTPIKNAIQNRLLKSIPGWYDEYPAFSEILRDRNLWLIRSRFIAVALLSLVALYPILLPGINASLEFRILSPLLPFLVLAFNILFSGYIKHSTCANSYSDQLLLAFYQIAADLTMLSILVYISGSMTSLCSVLFVFHVIIAGLMFPALIVTSIAGSIVLLYNVFSLLEINHIIPHHTSFLSLPISVFENTTLLILLNVLFSGTIVACAFISYKISSEMVKLQLTLHDAFDRLKAADKDKQKYIIAITHELKQPVGAVTSFLQLINQKILGEIPQAVSEVLDKCIRRNNEAIEMINNILKISRLRLSNEMKKEDVHLGNIIHELLQRYESSISQKNINLSVQLADEPCIISGDDYLLTLAISNLFSNAIKYTPANGSISISLSNSNNAWRLQIADNGIGVPPEDIGKVFNDFFRASNLSGKNTEGAGIGLSAVKNIIEQHNATISFQSPSPIGSIELPGTAVTIFFHTIAVNSGE